VSIRRVAGLDLAWAGERIVVAVGPLDVLPSREDLSRALDILMSLPATSRIGLVPSPSGRTWRVPAAGRRVSDNVHELPAFGDPADMLTAVSRIEPETAVALAISGDHLALSMDHVMGDGYFLTRLLAASIELALGRQVPQWALRPPARRALPRALLSEFGRHPVRARTLVAQRRASHGGAVDDRGSHPVDLRGGDGPAGLAWSPRSASVVVRVSSPSVLRQIKAWRRDHAPGVSTVPIAIAASEIAIRSAGIRTAKPPLVLFDARRYVRPDGVDVTGNFCAGLRIASADFGSPSEVDAALKEAAALGRPLAVVALAAVQSVLRRPHGTMAAASDGRWDVAYTHMGRPAELARLTRGSTRAPTYIGLLPPSGPNGVTIAMSEIGDRLNVSVSFHADVVDRVDVEAVADALATDPVALLERHRQAGANAVPQLERGSR